MSMKKTELCQTVQSGRFGLLGHRQRICPHLRLLRPGIDSGEVVCSLVVARPIFVFDV